MEKDNANALNIAILCGGSGTRLFPVSRELMPKQFVPFFENTSLFQQSVLRNAPLSERFFIITNESHYFLAKNEIEKLKNAKNTNANHALKNSAKFSYILESISKNTASALLFVALQCKSDEVILALPSDHIIKDLPHYENSVKKAVNLARNGKIVLFGIKPSSPNTGYGYIKDFGCKSQSESRKDSSKDSSDSPHNSPKDSCDSPKGSKDSRNLRESKVAFFEKPDFATAQKYLSDGGYFWNSGAFCFKASALIDEFKAHKPELLKVAQNALKNALKSDDFVHLQRKDCEAIEDISIDYAIMEKSRNLALLEADWQWSDVGSFDSLCDEYPKDSAGNAHNGEILALESQNNFILQSTTSKKLTAMLGVSDLVVVDTDDCLLISKAGESQSVKKIAQILKEQNSDLVRFPSIVYRPWGSYQVLLEGAFYKIKQIVVKPKKRLSLQKHFHRNEHWIVVSGSAVVQINEHEFVLNRNESTYIPMGSVHRLSNEGKIDLVIIEAQVGEYLGEDDIVRIEDDYRRK